MEYISNYIDLGEVEKTKFNIVASGCGTGKTFWVANDVRKQFPHIRPEQMLFVTSRALIVEQQIKNKGITKFNPRKVEDIRYWNGEIDNLDEISKKGIQIMTYDKIIDIIKTKNAEGFRTLGKIRVMFFDECHTLFSDAPFIRDMEALKVWVREILYDGSKVVIGLTATPRILFHNQVRWGVGIKQLNKDVIVNYRAKQLYCTDFNSLHFLLANGNIQGKTIVMCYSIKDCYRLKEKVPNSFVLVSKSNSTHYMPEMDEVRDYIIENEGLPDTYLEVTKRGKHKVPVEYERRKLEVLISTSTLREGINLREESGIKNVAICFTDEMHISQWVGRCRYNVENLIVANTYIRSDNYNADSYLTLSRKQFNNYMKNRNNTRWFDSIAHLVEHDITQIKHLQLNEKEQKFTTYINTRWLVPSGANEKEMEKYRIYRQEDKDEIVAKLIYCRLIDLPDRYITFNRAIRFMQDTLGYIIETGRFVKERRKYTYKIVIDFEEDYKNKKGEAHN